MAHIGNEILSAVIDIEACVGCGTCVEACPLECLELSDEGYAVMANAEACVLMVPARLPAPTAPSPSSRRFGPAHGSVRARRRTKPRAESIDSALLFS